MWSDCCYLLFFVVYLVAQNICDCVVVLQSVANISTHMPTLPHKSPVVQSPTAPTADGKIECRLSVFICAFPHLGRDPEGSPNFTFSTIQYNSLQFRIIIITVIFFSLMTIPIHC